MRPHAMAAVRSRSATAPATAASTAATAWDAAEFIPPRRTARSLGSSAAAADAPRRAVRAMRAHRLTRRSDERIAAHDGSRTTETRAQAHDQNTGASPRPKHGRKPTTKTRAQAHDKNTGASPRQKHGRKPRRETPAHGALGEPSVCGLETDRSATHALHRWIARHRRWQSVPPRTSAFGCLVRGAVRNGSRIQMRSFRTGAALAVVEDCLAPTHPSSSRTGHAMPLVDAPASTGFEKVGEWMDPSCTVWARMEFAEPIPAPHGLTCGER